MTDCSTLQSQAVPAHHCCDQEAQGQRAAATSGSHEAGPQPHPVLLPALLAHSDLSFLLLSSCPSTNHQVLVHLWGFIPEHQEKAPNHSTSDRIEVLSLLPSLVSQRFSFYPPPFFLSLSLFFFKAVHSKLKVATIHQLSAIPLSFLLIFSFVACAYSNWSANHLEKTFNIKVFVYLLDQDFTIQTKTLLLLDYM